MHFNIRYWLGPLLLGVTLLSTAHRAYGQSTDEDKLADADSVLALTGTHVLLNAVPNQILMACQRRSPGSLAGQEKLYEIVQEQLDGKQLYHRVMKKVAEASKNGELASFAEWQLTDWCRRVNEAMRDQTQSGVAPPPLDSFSDKRKALARRIVKAWKYWSVTSSLIESQNDVVRRIGGLLDDDSLRTMPEFTPDDLRRNLGGSDTNIIRSVLAGLAPIDDAVIERYADLYESESGQWFINVSFRAMSNEIRRGGEDVVTAWNAAGN